MKKITHLFQWIIVLTVWCINVAQAEVRIVIDEGVDGARPIAIAPFKWNGPGSAPENVADIISADLRNSGKFNPIPLSKCHNSLLL